MVGQIRDFGQLSLSLIEEGDPSEITVSNVSCSTAGLRQSTSRSKLAQMAAQYWQTERFATPLG